MESILRLKYLVLAATALLYIDIIRPASGCVVGMASQTSTPIKRVVKNEGWPIPGLKMNQEVLEVTKLVRGGKTINEARLVTTEDVFITLNLYGLVENSLYVRASTCILRQLYSYEYQGKVFAYRVSLVPTVTGEDGIRHFVGAAFTLHYYDEDGDGRFEVRYSDLNTEVVPKWVD